METQEKKTYRSPRLDRLGSVRELTALVSVPPCSAIEDFSSQDNLCEPPPP